MLKVTVIIPARMAATRFPGKPLASILGKPMIQWVCERSSKAAVDRVVVATDDARIMSAVAAFNGEAILTRADHPNGTSRIAEVAEPLAEGIIVNVQGDEPILDPRAIDAVTAPLLTDPTCQMATLAEPISTHADLFNPNIVKVVTDARDQALYFSRAPIPYVKHRDMASPSWPASVQPDFPFLRHVGIYAYRRSFLMTYQQQPSCPLEEIEGLEQLRALHMGVNIHVARGDFSGIGVDTPADLVKAEAYLKAEGCVS